MNRILPLGSNRDTQLTDQLVDIIFLQMANEVPLNLRARRQNLEAERSS